MKQWEYDFTIFVFSPNFWTLDSAQTLVFGSGPTFWDMFLRANIWGWVRSSNVYLCVRVRVCEGKHRIESTRADAIIGAGLSVVSIAAWCIRPRTRRRMRPREQLPVLPGYGWSLVCSVLCVPSAACEMDRVRRQSWMSSCAYEIICVRSQSHWWACKVVCVHTR